MSRHPWMPLYVADYLLDTADLRYDEHGCYLLMLMLAWRSGNGSITGDTKELKAVLQRLANLHGLTFNRIVPKLLDRYFEQREDGRFYQKRVEKELRKAEELSEKQARNARERWAKVKENKDLVDATAMPSQSQSPSQSHKNKKERESAAPNGAALHTNDSANSTKRGGRGSNGGTLHSSPNPSLPNSRKLRGTRLSEDWQPSPEDLAFAGNGLTAEAVVVEADKFRDYWIAAAGPNSVKRDWSAAWRNWCRGTKGTNGTNGWNPGKAAEAKPRTEDEINKLFERYRRKQGLTARSSMEH